MTNYIIRTSQWLLLVGSFTLLGIAAAETSIRNIDGELSAYFPNEPKFNGEAGSGGFKLRSYEYTDEHDIIVYTASYQLHPHDFDGQPEKDVVRDYAEGQAISVSGGIVDFEYKSIGDAAAIFSMEFEYQGVKMRKYSIVVLNNGRLKQWSVQDILGYSSADAKTIFYNHVGSAKLQ